jgi:aspartate/methionine/tyrosine aminotransferase
MSLSPGAGGRARGAQIAPFYAGQIGRRAAELKAAGRTIIPMHFGQPTDGTPPAARAAAARWLALDPTGYFESAALVERIARHYRDSYGVEVAPQRIQLTTGASAALVAAFAALFAAGDRVGVARPGYPAYRNVLTGLGRVPVEIECGASDGFRLTAALAAAAGPLQGLVVASPANPTGAMLGRAELAELVAYCRERGTRLISDELYHGISYGKRAVSALELDEQAIVINSFSKLYRMPGWRLGWMVVPAALAAHVSAYLINFCLTPPTLAQHAALAALDDPASLAASVSRYAHNRELLLREFAALGMRGLVAPDGAFYLYADVGHLTDDSLSFCLRMLEDTGVAAAPGIDFDLVHGRHYLRFSFAVAPEQAAQAVALLAPWFARQRL